MNALASLSFNILLLSFLTFGGVSTVLPEMHRLLVDQQHWLSDSEFGALYALSQAAPGPNMLYVALFGLHVAGIPGAISSTLAMITPSSVMAIAFSRRIQSHPKESWSQHLRNGLAPITIGLVLASGWLLAIHISLQPTSATGETPPWREGLPFLLLTLATALLHVRTKLNPVLLIILGAGLGIVLS